MIRSCRDRLFTPEGLAAIFVAMLPLVYFFPATCGAIVLCPDDGLLQNLPLRAAAADMLRDGHVPLWNPWLFCGMPLLGAAQAGILFPLNWFYLVFSLPTATNLMMLSAYMVAALGAYLCARRSGSSVAGAGLTSLAWQAGAFLVAQVSHTNIVHTAAPLPWLFWAIDGYAQTGDRRRGVMVAVIVALQCFAGHQQTFVYGLLVAAAYAVVLWRTTNARAYLWSLVLLGAGIVLAAVQILPTLELLRHSLRSEASYDFFTSFSMPRRFLGGFLAPYLLGGGDGHLFRAPYVGPSFYAEYVPYVGLATLALAGLALVFKRDARTIFWAAVVSIGILLALGRYAPFEFSALIYRVPVLNLFRVPARHLLEVEFGLAILAGRGLTALMAAPDRKIVMRWAGFAGAILVVAACVAITAGRPANFHLARNAPVTVLRAPELFLPPVIALLSAGALWFAVARRGFASTLLLVAVVYVDLNLWGQFSGWRVSSPTVQSELWQEPAVFRSLREREKPEARAPYRVLTQDHFFNPKELVSYAAPEKAWLLPLQPDIAMMWGWENAAGYEGFGLARYSRLAGDMKVWGDLTDPERTLRGTSRELDLLNVSYLLVRSAAAPVSKQTATPSPELVAMETYGGHKFAQANLNLAGTGAGERISFEVPGIETKRIALTTMLAWSENAPDGSVIAHLKLRTKDGQTFEFELRAGEHTSEWAHDRADIHARIQHKRAPLASSYLVTDPQLKFEGHEYVCAFDLPAPAVLVSGEIAIMPVVEAPQLSLNVGRISLIHGDRAVPIRREWITLKSTPWGNVPAVTDAAPRWKRVVDIRSIAVFENNRALPRTWLASGERVATGPQQLEIIRTGKIPGDTKWDPFSEVLVEKPTGVAFAREKPPPGRTEVTRLEPNRVTVATDASAPSLLILADNYYPGWHAEVDGRRTRIARVNYNQRGVAVGAGKHVVNFNYQPNSVLIGLLVSGISLLVLLCWMNSQRREPQP